jgi:hypothetical protein
MKVVFNLRFRTQMGQKLSVCIDFAADASETVLPLLYLNQDFWQASLDVDTSVSASIRYRYIFISEEGEEIKEAEKARIIQWTKNQQTDVITIDSWNDAGAYENAFYTAPFDAVFLPKRDALKTKKRTPFTHLFKAKAPLLQQDTVVHDGFVRLPATPPGKAAAWPFRYSAWSEQSFGIGEFTDLKLLADWAARTGLKLIQILPINDTTATATWRDSYPYAAISAFALHPIYINLGKVGRQGAGAKQCRRFAKKDKGTEQSCRR